MTTIQDPYEYVLETFEVTWDAETRRFTFSLDGVHEVPLGYVIDCLQANWPHRAGRDPGHPFSWVVARLHADRERLG